ncbi:hypothetical protein PVK06_037233 [Gossypium arboreum]|uniref:Uncharacterized protein n=1 Tax=Gossypium arboreum TaxID=29729 RepID=A0ABR0MX87_GOSAR|nr:hypothetical protein PVK06_037233 [Gossypium arboreum]
MLANCVLAKPTDELCGLYEGYSINVLWYLAFTSTLKVPRIWSICLIRWSSAPLIPSPLGCCQWRGCDYGYHCASPSDRASG